MRLLLFAQEYVFEEAVRKFAQAMMCIEPAMVMLYNCSFTGEIPSEFLSNLFEFTKWYHSVFVMDTWSVGRSIKAL